jgi:3-isopropylmalate/(R)-2-methylmalate dehydratase large subunit
MIAPDEKTFSWLEGRAFSPKGAELARAVEEWRNLKSDDDAEFDREIAIDVSALAPMITFGVSPDAAAPVDGVAPASTSDAERRAAEYMRFDAGERFALAAVNRVFIGSCTNSRLEDLRLAAEVMRGRKVRKGVIALVVPGSAAVKRAAEAEGLDRVFKDAGAEWREPGCSMCIAMNGDQLSPGQYSVSTSNRNFEGRQGKGGRTFLASPLTAAASAVTGVVTDVRSLL